MLAVAITGTVCYDGALNLFSVDVEDTVLQSVIFIADKKLCYLIFLHKVDLNFKNIFLRIILTHFFIELQGYLELSFDYNR